METSRQVEVRLLPCAPGTQAADYDWEGKIYQLEQQEKLLSSNADTVDVWIAIASGLLCGMLDVCWTGAFSLEKGRELGEEQVQNFVVKTAHLLGCEDEDCQAAVRFLERKFPIPSDGCTPAFGGGLQHHLRDFAHHPTIVGLAFSLLTQFTELSYGTDKQGRFVTVPVPEKSRAYIGKDVPQRIVYGTLIWFFHLVSDMAGSGNTIAKSGGTGIPGPLLSLAKELSALPIFHHSEGTDPASLILSKLFNGTLLAAHDENGKVIAGELLRFDLRTELGIGIELGKQALPVIANECIVRTAYLIRRFASELKNHNIRSVSMLKELDWNAVKPAGNPTIDRMLLIACGVFSTVDIAAAAASANFIVSVNYVGVGRFAVAIGKDVSWALKRRDVAKLREMYEKMECNTFRFQDNTIYERIGKDMETDKFGLTLEQTILLYNLERCKVLNDIEQTHLPVNQEPIKSLKREWLADWQKAITDGFGTFVQDKEAEMVWYSVEELMRKIEAEKPEGTWFRLVLLETMLFEPYYTLTTEQDKKGNEIPSKKYKTLENPLVGFKKDAGDACLEAMFQEKQYYTPGYIKRLRKCYGKVLAELNEVLKSALKAVAVAAVVAVPVIVFAGALAPQIAVALVGSNFAGLHGAALTATCLAYLGGGAVAAGGAGMAGGTIAIVGGATVLGLTAGAGAGSTVGAISMAGKKMVILESAKLLVAVREIFLNDEHDMAFSDSVYEQYVQNIVTIEKDLIELRMKEEDAAPADKKRIREEIKNAEDTVKAMKIARKNLLRFKSAFAEGQEQETI